MNQSKFSFKEDVVTLLGTVGFAFFCFLSFNFLTLGEIVISIAIAMTIALLLGGLAFTAKVLKKTPRPDKNKVLCEWALVFLFVMLAFVAVFPFSHYWVVSQRKAVIQQKLSQNITEARNMFAEYESYANNREYTYVQQVSNAILKGHNGSYIYPSKYAQFGFQAGGDDNKQKEDKINDYHVGLFEYPFDFQSEQQKDSVWLAKAQNSITLWAPISIVSIVKDLDYNSQNWYDNLVQLSTFRATGEETTVSDFFYDGENWQQVRQLFKKEIKDLFFETTLIALAIAIVCYLFMLLPYIIISRHDKFQSFKVLFQTNNKSTDNNSDGTIVFK